MKVLSLIKKDILLMKKYLVIVLAISVVFPIFIYYKAPSLAGFTSFLMTAIFAVYMALQSISMTETKYPKAEALLCASPYMRKALVFARYLFYLCIFCVVWVVFQAIGLAIGDFTSISFHDTALSLLIGSILLCVYLPLQYKLGFEKMKYLLMILILLTPFSLPYIVDWLEKTTIDFSFVSSLSEWIRTTLYLLFALVINAISLVISTKIYEKKEL